MLGLQQGNAVLKEIHKEMNPESVERLMEETAEAQAYQRVSTLSHTLSIKTMPRRLANPVTSLFDAVRAGNRRDARYQHDGRRRRRRSIRTRSTRTRSWHPCHRANGARTHGRIAVSTANRACCSRARGTTASESKSTIITTRETSCSRVVSHPFCNRCWKCHYLCVYSV